MNAPFRCDALAHEDRAMLALREALGTVAVAPAVAYSLSRAGASWQLRRLDRPLGEIFQTRAAALAAMRRAVVRSSAYFLAVEGCNGEVDVQFLNWDEHAAETFGIRP